MGRVYPGRMKMVSERSLLPDRQRAVKSCAQNGVDGAPWRLSTVDPAQAADPFLEPSILRQLIRQPASKLSIRMSLGAQGRENGPLSDGRCRLDLSALGAQWTPPVPTRACATSRSHNSTGIDAVSASRRRSRQPG